MERKAFDAAIRAAGSEDERVAAFGALLAKESGLGGKLVIVEGSAIEVYLASAEYVSQDIDVVGAKGPIVPVLRKWGFREVEGRSERAYWVKEGLGQIDLVGAPERSGLPPREQPTPYGTVCLAPVESLIVRRLMRAGREQSSELFRQAEVLAAEYGADLDWNYLRSEAKYERVLPLYEQLRKQVGSGVPRR